MSKSTSPWYRRVFSSKSSVTIETHQEAPQEPENPSWYCTIQKSNFFNSGEKLLPALPHIIHQVISHEIPLPESNFTLLSSTGELIYCHKESFLYRTKRTFSRMILHSTKDTLSLPASKEALLHFTFFMYSDYLEYDFITDQVFQELLELTDHISIYSLKEFLLEKLRQNPLMHRIILMLIRYATLSGSDQVFSLYGKYRPLFHNDNYFLSSVLLRLSPSEARSIIVAPNLLPSGERLKFASAYVEYFLLKNPHVRKEKWFCKFRADFLDPRHYEESTKVDDSREEELETLQQYLSPLRPEHDKFGGTVIQRNYLLFDWELQEKDGEDKSTKEKPTRNVKEPETIVDAIDDAGAQNLEEQILKKDSPEETKLSVGSITKEQGVQTDGPSDVELRSKGQQKFFLSGEMDAGFHPGLVKLSKREHVKGEKEPNRTVEERESMEESSRLSIHKKFIPSDETILEDPCRDERKDTEFPEGRKKYQKIEYLQNCVYSREDGVADSNVLKSKNNSPCGEEKERERDQKDGNSGDLDALLLPNGIAQNVGRDNGRLLSLKLKPKDKGNRQIKNESYLEAWKKNHVQGLEDREVEEVEGIGRKLMLNEQMYGYPNNLLGKKKSDDQSAFFPISLSGGLSSFSPLPDSIPGLSSLESGLSSITPNLPDLSTISSNLASIPDAITGLSAISDGLASLASLSPFGEELIEEADNSNRKEPWGDLTAPQAIFHSANSSEEMSAAGIFSDALSGISSVRKILPPIPSFSSTPTTELTTVKETDNSVEKKESQVTKPPTKAPSEETSSPETTLQTTTKPTNNAGPTESRSFFSNLRWNTPITTPSTESSPKVMDKPKVTEKVEKEPLAPSSSSQSGLSSFFSRLPETPSLSKFTESLPKIPEVPALKSLTENITKIPDVAPLSKITDSLPVVSEVPLLSKLTDNLSVVPNVPLISTITDKIPALPEVPVLSKLTDNIPSISNVSSFSKLTDNLPSIPNASTFSKLTDNLPSLPEVSSFSKIKDNLPSVAVLSKLGDKLPSIPEVPSLSKLADKLPSIPEVPSLSKLAENLPSLPDASSFSKIANNLPSIPDASSLTHLTDNLPGIVALPSLLNITDNLPTVPSLSSLAKLSPLPNPIPNIVDGFSSLSRIPGNIETISNLRLSSNKKKKIPPYCCEPIYSFFIKARDYLIRLVVDRYLKDKIKSIPGAEGLWDMTGSVASVAGSTVNIATDQLSNITQGFSSFIESKIPLKAATIENKAQVAPTFLATRQDSPATLEPSVSLPLEEPSFIYVSDNTSALVSSPCKILSDECKQVEIMNSESQPESESLLLNVTNDEKQNTTPSSLLSCDDELCTKQLRRRLAVDTKHFAPFPFNEQESGERHRHSSERCNRSSLHSLKQRSNEEDYFEKLEDAFITCYEGEALDEDPAHMYTPGFLSSTHFAPSIPPFLTPSPPFLSSTPFSGSKSERDRDIFLTDSIHWRDTKELGSKRGLSQIFYFNPCDVVDRFGVFSGFRIQLVAFYNPRSLDALFGICVRDYPLDGEINLRLYVYEANLKYYDTIHLCINSMNCHEKCDVFPINKLFNLPSCLTKDNLLLAHIVLI